MCDDRRVNNRPEALSFGSQATGYNRARPSYPSEAVEWLIADASRVVDVGAGTGKLTQVLVDLGREVTAVEPDDRMREQLQRALPAVRALPGMGERLPLEAAAAEAITFGQAWHWVDPARGSAEADRVLVDGGVLGLIWNFRDDDDPWVARLTEVLHRSPAEELGRRDRPPVTAPFVVAEQRLWRWVNRLSADDLLTLTASRSYVITAGDDERQRILDGARDLGRERMAADGGDLIELPYVTVAWRFSR